MGTVLYCKYWVHVWVYIWTSRVFYYELGQQKSKKKNKIINQSSSIKHLKSFQYLLCRWRWQWHKRYKENYEKYKVNWLFQWLNMQNNPRLSTKDGNCKRLLNGWLIYIYKNWTCKTSLLLQPKVSSFDMQGSSRPPLKAGSHHAGASRAFLLHVSWVGPPLGKLAKIRKVGEDWESWDRLGKFIQKIRKVETDKENSSKRLGKLEVRPKKKKGPRLILVWKLGKLGQFSKVGMGYYEN